MTAQQASVTPDVTPSMASKVVLITGGSGGIGKATAIGLAALGARVAITGRDLERVEAAAVEIRGATGNPDVVAFGADLSSQAEVRRLAAEVIKAALASLVVRKQPGPSVKYQNSKDLAALKALVEAGRVTPVIAGTYPLSGIPAAIGHVGEGHARGTVVITV